MWRHMRAIASCFGLSCPLDAHVRSNGSCMQRRRAEGQIQEAEGSSGEVGHGKSQLARQRWFALELCYDFCSYSIGEVLNLLF